MNWIIVKRFPLETDLTHIVGFLRERHIQHHVYEDAGEQVIAVSDAKMVEPIKHFLADLEQGKFIIEQDISSRHTPRNVEIPSLWQQIISVPVTGALIALSVIGALLVAFDDNFPLVHWLTFQDFYQDKALPLSESLARGQVWRFITPAFLHFSFLHVLFNSLWVWDLGRRLEFLLGKRGYIIFFVFTAAVSNFAQYFWTNGGLFGGMSGVVYALIGFIMVSQRLAPNRLTAVPPAIIGFMLIWLVLCMTGVVDYFIGAGVANAAHLGGLLAGCFFAFATVKRISSKR